MISRILLRWLFGKPARSDSSLALIMILAPVSTYVGYGLYPHETLRPLVAMVLGCEAAVLIGFTLDRRSPKGILINIARVWMFAVGIFSLAAAARLVQDYLATGSLVYVSGATFGLSAATVLLQAPAPGKMLKASYPLTLLNGALALCSLAVFLITQRYPVLISVVTSLLFALYFGRARSGAVLTSDSIRDR